MKKSNGFTLIELLIVIAIIGILVGILLPALNKMQINAMRAECKTTITQLAQALKSYETDQGVYPPEEGTSEGTGTYAYFDESLVRYLDGDKSNKGPASQYFEFKQQYLSGTGSNAYQDRFEENYWYHNFQKDNVDTKVINAAQGELHPWYNRILFRSFQVYSKANYGAPDPQSHQQGVLKWITNYAE